MPLVGFAASARATNAQPAAMKTTDSGGGLTAEGRPVATADGQRDYSDYFVVKMIDGEATCLDATFAEVPITMPKADDERGTLPDAGQKPVNPGYELAHAQQQQSGDGVDKVGSGGLTILFNELSQLQNDPNRAELVAAFTKAAQIWTDRIKSPVTVTFNIDYGPLVPNCTVTSTEDCTFDTTTIGSTGSAAILVDYPGVRTNLRASSSSAGETAIYNALPPGSTVPSDSGNGAAIRVNRALAKGLGLSTSSATAATIGFNKKFNFDFNPDDGIAPGKTDFVAVAAHEMGHALGFVSGGSDSISSFMAVWDIFRFRPGANFANFSTAERVMTIGGPNPNPEINQVYFTGQSFTYGSANTPATELGLSTGGPDPTPGTGDGRQSSHWKDDSSQPVNYIGIMDPTISSGVHKEITDNDLMALETMGWNLVATTAPPTFPPAAAQPPNNNFASAQVLTGCSGNVAGVNVGATREAGEVGNPESDDSNRSVWYDWTAPSTGSVTFDTIGSRFDTVLGVYTGSSVSGLSVVASNDDFEDPNTPMHETSSSVTFNATQGTTYRIEVNGFNNQNLGGDFGNFKLNWTASNCSVTPPPVTVQLSQGSYAVSEAGGSLTVPVTRTDAAGAATVDYATSDPAGLTPCSTFNGVASSRCDYATTIGTLQFAPGETTKNIFIPLVDDAWAEGAETFTLTLSNASGANLGATTTASVSVSDNESATSPTNPVDQSSFFIRQQYVDFLGREPDSVGLAGWQGVLNNCPSSGKDSNGNFCDRIEVSAGFFRSKEFQERGYFVYKFYSAVGRIPLYPEFMPDLAKVSGFLSDAQLEANKAAFVNEFMARAEFQTKYAALVTPTDYVNALLTNVGLPNHPSKAGWIGGLANGSLTRAKVLRELTESSEMVAKYNTEAFVIMQYFGYLRRSADASYLAWIDIMNQNPNNYRGMIDGFLNSDEYRKRFGQ
jgi:hypothetical protein